MQTFRTVEGQAPSNARQFRAAVTRGFRAANPDAEVVFTSRVRRFGPKAHQPAGTVSFAADVALVVGDYHERFIATAIRYGGTINGRIGTGSVESFHGSMSE